MRGIRTGLLPCGKEPQIGRRSNGRANWQLRGLWGERDRPATGEDVIAAKVRATTLASHEAAVGWFQATISEAASPGVIDALARSTTPSPDPASEDALAASQIN
jgi:hypothetical protein